LRRWWWRGVEPARGAAALQGVRLEAPAGRGNRRQERLVTSCGQCRITLELGAKNAKWDKTPESLLELVADNLAD
jgi:hypothetical protein